MNIKMSDTAQHGERAKQQQLETRQKQNNEMQHNTRGEKNNYDSHC